MPTQVPSPSSPNPSSTNTSPVRVHNRRKKHAAVSDGLVARPAESISAILCARGTWHRALCNGLNDGLGGETNEMMLLEYAGERSLCTCLQRILISQLPSGQAHAETSPKLGSGAWNKAKRKAAEKARDTAAELLNLYAQRAAQSGHKSEINELDYQTAFADGFGYEETETRPPSPP